MSLLKAEPAKPVRSLPELFALAHALEEEAERRYAELASGMDAIGLPRVAAVFRDLVEEERGHAHHVEEWSRGVTGAVPDHGKVRWDPPETFDEEEARAIASSHLATAYRALSMAVRNEERAFALWTYIAAGAETPEVRRAAERMAGEELRHAALLRKARRRAFREDRPAGALREPPLARAVAAERRLAVVLAGLAERAPGRAAACRQLAEDALAMAAEAEGVALEEEEPAAARTAAPGGAGDWEEALRLAERASEGYLDATDAAREDAHLGILHSLSERAVARIAVLRRDIAAAAG